jgi:aminoglycoside 6'-N-acetyltransferase I
MQVRDLAGLGGGQLAEAARILREAIAGPSYKGPGEAEAEVASFLGENPERFALAALDDSRLLGWVGAVRSYSHSLELHPLVIDPVMHRQGVGRLLVAALEARAAEEGFLAIHLGTDDEVGGTSLFGADGFPDALAKLATIAPTALGHPFFFYRKLGFEPVGVIPDANGFGKPDLLMSKRVGQRPESTTLSRSSPGVSPGDP